jgi:hypothetical protein
MRKTTANDCFEGIIADSRCYVFASLWTIAATKLRPSVLNVSQSTRGPLRNAVQSFQGAVAQLDVNVDYHALLTAIVRFMSRIKQCSVAALNGTLLQAHFSPDRSVGVSAAIYVSQTHVTSLVLLNFCALRMTSYGK